MPLSRLHNSLGMLRQAGILTERDGLLSCVQADEPAWGQAIASWTAKTMAARMAAVGTHALQMHDGSLLIDPMLLPGPVDGLKLWLIEFGIASRDGSASRRWRVSVDYHPVFIAAARDWNRASRRRLSQAELDKRLDQQAIDGAVAEEWVLARERRALEGHPLIDLVVRTSIEDAAAGYDISSFTGFQTMVHDRYVEVKSYRGERRFFWTSNEVAAARDLGEAYHLCLVDRDRMDDPAYEPEIIRGPYAALMETKDSGWSISPSTFECIAIT